MKNKYFGIITKIVRFAICFVILILIALIFQSNTIEVSANSMLKDETWLSHHGSTSIDYKNEAMNVVSNSNPVSDDLV